MSQSGGSPSPGTCRQVGSRTSGPSWESTQLGSSREKRAVGIACHPALGPRWSHQMGPPEPGANLFATALWDSGTQALLTIGQAVEELVPQVAAPKARHQTCVQETWSRPEGAGRGGVHGRPVTCANLGLAPGSSCEHAKNPQGGDGQRWMRSTCSQGTGAGWEPRCVLAPSVTASASAVVSRMQTPLAVGAVCLGGHPLGGSFKSLGARCGIQTLHSSGRSWDLGVPF